MRNKFLLLLVAVILVTILFKAVSFSPELVSFSGPTMGTTYTVKYVTNASSPDRESLKADVDEALIHVNKLMSTYDPNSELSLFNKLPAGSSVRVTDEMAYVLGEALELSKITDGKYDVTVGPLVNLWGFGPGEHKDTVPSEADIEEAKNKVGFQHISLEDRELSKATDVYVDLSSIAKGFGVDEVARTLTASGVTDFLVEVGGEIRVSGFKLDGKKWHIGVEAPAGGHNIAQRIIEADNVAIATSGDYRNYFEKNGVRYSHTIDPTTGKPITHRLVSVTVVDSNTTRADGLATAITVLGPEQGLEFAEDNDIAAYMLVKEDFGFKEQYSSAFAPYVEN